MRRTLLTRRWLGLTALALVAVVAFAALGTWQWQRTQDILEAERAASRLPVPVEQVAPAGEPLPGVSVGRPVTATGRYAADGQRLVADRGLDGRAGSWVLTPLLLEDGTAVAVVRGWVPEIGTEAEQVPAGSVEVTGVLQPEEAFYAEGGTRADGRLTRISSDTVAPLVTGDLRSGYVMLTGQRPASDPAPVPVPPTVVTADVPFPLQNFFYAFQWWFFAAFVVFLWFRWLRLEARERAEEAQPAPAAAEAPPSAG
ncbi:MAG: SURF1 family protein [Candidatus Nanopelagicales bacterium]